jgi:hypothetical protein
MKLVPFLSLVSVVAGILQRSAIGQFKALAPGPSPAAGYRAPVIHGDDFVPDLVLDVTYQDVPVACQSRPSVVVNGTSPGPALRIPAGKTTWIRVYNSMSDYNVTMVSSKCSPVIVQG